MKDIKFTYRVTERMKKTSRKDAMVWWGMSLGSIAVAWFIANQLPIQLF